MIKKEVAGNCCKVYPYYIARICNYAEPFSRHYPDKCRGASCGRPKNIPDHKNEHKDSIGNIISAFKPITTVAYINIVKSAAWTALKGKLWQRNYWEHIIRDEKAYFNISEYIKNNLQNWNLDKLK